MFGTLFGNKGASVPPLPPDAVEIQLTGIEPLPGRVHDHVRTFGTLVGDMAERVVEVHLTARDAADIIEDAHRMHEFPVIVVPKKRYAHVLNAGEIKLIYFGQKES